MQTYRNVLFWGTFVAINQTCFKCMFPFSFIAGYYYSCIVTTRASKLSPQQSRLSYIISH